MPVFDHRNVSIQNSVFKHSRRVLFHLKDVASDCTTVLTLLSAYRATALVGDDVT